MEPRKFYFINTDWNSRNDIVTCDLWFDNQMAFAGDHEFNMWKHSGIFKKLSTGDILFMYHSKKDYKKHGKKGFVGIGRVKEFWDRQCYEGSRRLMYQKEPYEYRIGVDWFSDWRLEPKSEWDLNLHITPGTWYKIKRDCGEKLAERFLF